jgi:hypothetical protein
MRGTLVVASARIRPGQKRTLQSPLRGPSQPQPRLGFMPSVALPTAPRERLAEDLSAAARLRALRQPQVAKACPLKDAVTIAAEPVAARVARPLAVLLNDPKSPFLFEGACSTMKVMALCISLPEEMPWRTRASRKSTGAA